MNKTTGFATNNVRRYYERHTARFLAYGQGGGVGAIHRAVWGPGVSTREQAFRFVENRLADAIRTLQNQDNLIEVVDLGCGVGGSLCYLAGQLPIRGTGVTVSPLQARLANECIREIGLEDRIQCREGDYSDPTLVLPVADLVYAIESFVHGPEPGAFFSQCARIVRPGGLLAVCDDMWRRGDDTKARRHVARFKRGWHVHTLIDRKELRRLAGDAGFDHYSTDDLTPHLELQRPRDYALSLLTTLVGWFPANDYLGHLTGGGALQTCLRHGWIGYDLALFRRAE